MINSFLNHFLQDLMTKDMASLFRRIFGFKFKTSRSSSEQKKKRSKLSSTNKNINSSVSKARIVPTSGSFITGSDNLIKGSTSSITSKNKPTEIRTKRLMKEYKEIMKSIHLIEMRHEKPFFTIDLVDDNLFEWEIKVFQFDTDSQIHEDMKHLSIDCILLNATFPQNFPFEPPFIRVVHPHIEKGMLG